MGDVSDKILQALRENKLVYTKFLSANDTGLTNSHQSGIYISKPSYRILFDTPGQKGANKDKRVQIRWQDVLTTQSRFIYYGRGTRNEYRITRFGQGFPWLRDEYTGALFVLVQDEPEQYRAFVLNTDDEIEEFLVDLDLSMTETGRLINSADYAEPSEASPEDREELAFSSIVYNVSEFPDTVTMSNTAHEVKEKIAGSDSYLLKDPDAALIDLIDIEYKLFRRFEDGIYGQKILKGFSSTDEFLQIANSMLNRRKSRAGKSFEHHLSAMFHAFGLKFEEQAVTEGSKRPDFLFPSGAAYHDPDFPVENIITLAAKTTCKDRWRQILNEADRLRAGRKFLCTLQQGISSAQLQEMHDENVVLVVPKPYIQSFPREWRDKIWSIRQFIEYVKKIEGLQQDVLNSVGIRQES